MLKFNKKVKLILADVDETVADVYTPATLAMIDELNQLLEEDRVLFLISGGGLQSIRERIVDLLKPELRHRVIVAHCMGAEVWGFAPDGSILPKPFYGVYDQQFSPQQKQLWRDVCNQLIERFQLTVYPTQPRADFIKNSSADPLSIMFADRGPQITFEFTNSIDLTIEQKGSIEHQLNITVPQHHGSYDLRYPISDEAAHLLQKHGLPVTPKFGGMFALDFIIAGVDKTKAVQLVLSDPTVLSNCGINRHDIDDIVEIEIWGDKYSQTKGGPDFDMCRAVNPRVRAIDFRDENHTEIPAGYNIQFWQGSKRLHEGLLEYLQSRHSG